MKKLSKEEMKNLKGGVSTTGGGSCCWHTAGWAQSSCGYSQSDAQAIATGYALASGQHSYWCCASC